MCRVGAKLKIKVIIMRRYIITCDLNPCHAGYSQVAQAITLLDAHNEQPHRGVWLIRSELTAQKIRETILPYVDFGDRFFVCETGEDAAKFNALQRAQNRNVIQFETRRRSAMLSSVLHDERQGSRMLKSATGGSFR